VARGDLAYGEIFEVLAEDRDVGPFAGAAMLEMLFNRGYFCETAVTRDHRARREGAAARPMMAGGAPLG
jgi:hypothetical protein